MWDNISIVGKLRVVFAVLLFLAAALLPGLEEPVEEAPESIFQTRIGDAEVDLFIEGYWDASVKGSLGLALIPGFGLTYPYVFPGFSDGIVFEQKPDLILSLWLRERYFFETTVGEDYRMNTYLLGYQGKEGEFIRSVKAGNREIEISPYPYMDFPGSARMSPGLSALFQTDRSRHEVLLRYDPSLPQKKTFVGRNEVEEFRIGPPGYVKGRFFVLPDTDPDFLELYIEDRDGSVPEDGPPARRYRRATNFDYSYSPTDGTVTLTKAAAGRVLVYYEKGGQPVGAAGLGTDALPAYLPGPPIEIDPLGTPEDFSWARAAYMGRVVADWLRVSVGGRDALLLYDPGAYNPFEIQGVYSLAGFAYPGSGSSVPRIVRRGSDAVYTPGTPLRLAFAEESSLIRVLPETDQSRSMTARYPFAGDEPLLYGPDRIADGGGTDFEILVQSYTPVQSYTLTNDVIPGSVTVLRNGREENLFSVDYASGALSLPFEPAPSDRIEVFYRTHSGEGMGGDILFGTGSTIELRKDLILKLATGLRWNVLKGSYSTEPGDHPGLVGASARIEYTGENLRASVDGALLYTNPDTSGLLRLLGMEKHEMILEISKFNIFPSSIPLNAGNRGSLFFKNFETTDVLGSVTLNPYTWTPPSSQVFPYETGSKPGPYVASARAEGFDQVMVLDFDMAPGQEWVGAQMNLATGWDGALDLSKITAIRFGYKAAELTGEVSLHAHTGALDEDLDGDGILDEEAGPSSRGFEFNDGVLTLYVGGGQEGFGNEYRDSEDANRNAILDRENPDQVFAAQVPDPPANLTGPGGWQTGLLRIPAAERNRLAHVRAIRFIVKNETVGAAAGRILIGKVVFEGSSVSARVDDGGSLRLREIDESLADEPAAVPLHRAHREILSTFHSGGGDQRVLEAVWENVAAGDSWEIRSFTTEVPEGDYKKLNMFLRVADIDPGPGPAELTLAYTDAEGRGIRLEFDAPADNVWEKLSVDIPRRRAFLGSAELSQPPQIDASHGKLNRFSLRLSNPAGGTAGAGVLYLDEVYLSDPDAGLGFAGSVDLAFSIPGDVVSVGGVPVLRNLAVSEKLSGRTADFQTRRDEDTAPGYVTSATTASGEILGILLAEGEFAFNVLEDRTEYEGGHSVRFPAEGGAVVLRDRYKRDFNSPSPAMSRSSRVDASLLQGFDVTAGTETYLTAETLDQKWEAGIGFSRGDASLKTLATLQNLAGGYLLEDGSYGASWISAYRLVLPWTEGTRTERRGLLKLDGLYSGEPAGLVVSPEVSYINTGATDGRQRNVSMVSVEVPLRFREGVYDPGWRLSLLYSRRADTITGVRESGDFGSDAGTLAETLREQSYFYSSVPIAEIFLPLRSSRFPDDTAGLIQGEYIPLAGLRYSRAFGSRLADLFVPSQVEAEVKKTLVRGGDILSASNTWSLTLSNFAINLFGSQGAYPAFSWYAGDEFQIQNSAALLTREGDPDWDWTITSHQVAGFFGATGNQFIIDHSITIENRDEFTYRGTGSVKYLWRSEMIRDFGFRLMAAARDDGAYYSHTEKLDLTYDRKNGLKAYLVMGHETALTLRKNGFIKAEVNLGLGYEKDYSGLPPGFRLVFGLGGGISAHFMF